MVRERTGWALRESKLLVDTYCQHGRPVTYAEMRVERLWIVVNGLRAEASELAVVLEHWRDGFTEGDEAETLEDAAADLEAQSRRLLDAAYELRYERGEDDPKAEAAQRQAERNAPIPDAEVHDVERG